jgi:hypothetical protein
MFRGKKFWDWKGCLIKITLNQNLVNELITN